MTSVLAIAVAAGFLWSVVLFFTAVFVQERRQEAGFRWALAGAILYFIVFADRLPGSPMWLREPVALLPGVADGAQLFQSSLVALVVLLAVYLFRVEVFYQLFIKVDAGAEGESAEDLLNDAVAPLLSYVCFAICLICLLQPAYDIGVIGTVLLVLLMAALYFWRVVYRLFPYLENVWTFFVFWAAKLRIAINRVMVRAIAKINWLEQLRREGGDWASTDWAEARLLELDEAEAAAYKRRREVFDEAAQPSNANAQGRNR